MKHFEENFVKLLLAALGLCLVFGCGRENAGPGGAGIPAKHEHIPPHGGTPVVLGSEEYHLELVLDAATGMLQAYVMDGELENFVRIAPAQFEVGVKRPAGEEVLAFKAVPNRATGETVGDTSLFAAQADWLKTAKTFDAVVKQINVKGSMFQSIAFNFPKGNDTDEKQNK
jgi:hypothetical protein